MVKQSTAGERAKAVSRWASVRVGLPVEVDRELESESMRRESLLVDEAEEVEVEAVELDAEPPQDTEEEVDNAVDVWHLSRVGGPLTVEEAWQRADELRVLREYIMRA